MQGLAVRRAARLPRGVRSVLIADFGMLDVVPVGGAPPCDFLPADMQAKVSVMLPVSNPATARGAGGARRGHAQSHDRPLAAAADRGDPRGRRRPARHLRRGAGQRRRLRAPARDSRDRARRGAGVPQVRPAQRARRVSRGDAPRGDDRRADARARAPRAPRDGALTAIRP